MPDEEEFDRALRLAGNFNIIKCRAKIQHPDLPLAGNYLEVDNLAQRGSVVFVFEGKSKREKEAIQQLQKRLKSLILFREANVVEKSLMKYQLVRLLSYSFKRKSISEYDSKGKKIRSQKFSDVNILAEFLRNL